MKPTDAMIEAGLRELQNWDALPEMPEADAREMLDDVWRAMERARTASAGQISPTERERATALHAAQGAATKGGD